MPLRGKLRTYAMTDGTPLPLVMIVQASKTIEWTLETVPDDAELLPPLGALLLGDGDPHTFKERRSLGPGPRMMPIDFYSYTVPKQGWELERWARATPVGVYPDTVYVRGRDLKEWARSPVAQMYARNWERRWGHLTKVVGGWFRDARTRRLSAKATEPNSDT